ncbi:hypothetical protein NliqN6_4065 [Naganishia liquefaciens]|uniref:Uncharacterized protein n=1 Tax=Naganishia liquefaciens TaxID=104408 RepID=A0A8H3TVH9_9TREE|nr:hypothetical protein NliqN6_4065 [Naganishia liquefaciens]
MDMDTDAGPSNGHVDPPLAPSVAAPVPPELEIPSDLFEDLDPDDEIAYTLPVYMTQNLSPDLNLFQYPLHHRAPQVSEWAASRGQSVTARMKEQVERFELEIPIDMRSEVWDEEKAEQLGFAAEESGKKGKGREEGWGSKMRLRSEAVPEVTGYWAGVVHDGALHLHPVGHLQQLRPALGYLDALEAQDRAEKERARRRENGEDDDDDDDEPEPSGKASSSKAKPKKEMEVKTVQLSMAAAPEDTIPLRRGSKMGTGGTVGTTTQIRNKIVKALAAEAEDTWIPWEWDTDSPDMLRSLSRLLLPRKERVSLECETRPLDILSKKNIGVGARLMN